MNEWAARLLSVFPERAKADLDEYVQQVANDQAEHMYFNKEYDADVECRPTFEQISHERIINEANKNINVLKALENILNDRMNGYTALHNTLTKTNASYELLENVEGTLKIALDSLFMFTEQELMHCKQHVFLNDLRKSLNEMRTDAQRRITDYQKEINTAEKEVILAEKRLAKSKEALERSHDHRAKMESFELDVILNNARPALGISGFGASSANLGSRSIKEATLMANASAADEAITRIDREMKDDVRILLRAIEHRDHILSASRRAFQKLHRECKTVAHLTLLKIAEKEAEQAEQRRIVLDKMYRSVNAVDIDGDENEFIETHSGRDGALVLSAQALSLLGDLVHPPPVLDAMDGSSHGPARSNSVVAAGTAGPGEGEGGGYGRAGRDRSPHSQVRSRGSLSSSSDSSSRSPPSSPAMSKGRPSATSATGTPSSSNSSSSSASASAAAATTPSSSLPSSRFSFRRTLGLTSDSSHVISAPIVTTPTPAAASASVVVAAGKVGGEWAPAGPLKPTVGGAIGSGVSSAGNSGGGGGGGSGSAPPPTADFTAYLSQIFYTPGVQGTSNQKVCKETEASKRSTVPSASSAVSLAASNSSSRNSSNNRLEGTPADDKSSSIPTTPKVLIDDNYFCNGNAPGDVSKDVRQESLSFAKTPPIDDSSVDSPDTSSRKTANRNTKVTKSDLHCGALDWLRSNPHSYLIDAVEGISRAIKTQAGRNAFTTELNQFRSQKVEVGEGFEALGAVLWTTLSHCQAENDTHNASVIMMLSQTFYKKIEHKRKAAGASLAGNSPAAVAVDSDRDGDSDGDGDGEDARGVENRRYIKELLVTHPLWKDGNFWEQVLWQCAIEQLQTIPYDRPWHDMSREVRREAVRRVHEVIFSQVMAITHSMLELGCRAEQAREFLYRMCVIHQLSEAMRQTLLKHVAAAAKANHVHAHANGRRASSRRYSANSVHSANSSAHGGANNSRRSSAVSTTEEEQEAQPPAAQQALPVSAIQTLPSAPHLSVNGNPVAASVPLPPSPPQNSLSTNNELGDSVAV